MLFGTIIFNNKGFQFMLKFSVLEFPNFQMRIMSFEGNKLLVNLLRQGYSCIISKLWFNKPKIKCQME